jgi:glutamine amidotransferase
MCRIAAYFGPPVPLSRLMTEPPHGLLDQSRNAREMADGTIAGDGWGIGWCTGASECAPGMLKSTLPLWSDQNARTALPAIVAPVVVGHVRYASPGIDIDFTNTPLYTIDGFLYTHNGGFLPWPSPIGKAIRDRLLPAHEQDVKGATESELIAALWRTRRARDPGHDPAAALRAALGDCRDLAREHGAKLKANLILADRSGVLAVRYAIGEESNTLYTRQEGPGAGWIASEPLDAHPGWTPVPPSSLVRLDAAGLHLEPLDLG